MKKQTQYFINGLILLILAMLTITIAPIIIKKYLHQTLENYIYSEIEFFLLTACSIFYLFSPKFYKKQINTIFFSIIYYILFIKIFF